jgi:hypothetical protein
VGYDTKKVDAIGLEELSAFIFGVSLVSTYKMRLLHIPEDTIENSLL